MNVSNGIFGYEKMAKIVKTIPSRKEAKQMTSNNATADTASKPMVDSKTHEVKKVHKSLINVSSTASAATRASTTSTRERLLPTYLLTTLSGTSHQK